jgi:peptidyl-prolyl cis-trans isomerase C
MTSAQGVVFTLNGAPLEDLRAPPRAADPPIVVNGETVPGAAIAVEAQNHPAPKGKPELAWHKAAKALVIRTLLLQEARRQGLVATGQEVSPGLFETEEEFLVRELLEQEVPITPPTEEDIHEEWSRDPSRFRSPPLWEASHILCACASDDPQGRSEALARARILITRIIAEPGAFARVAAAESDCDSRVNGGKLGQIAPGDAVAEFEAALHGLAAGEMTAEPVLTRHGWHIIRLDAVAEGRDLPYAAVRQHLAAAMEKTAWARAAQALVTRLVAEAEIAGIDLHDSR